MSKQKQGVMLINQSLGSSENCHRCGKNHVDRVLHTDIDYISFRGYGTISGNTKDAIKKNYTKQCNEIFLCQKCYEANYMLDPSYIDETGQYQYTSVLLRDWKKTTYLTIEQAIEKFE